MRNIDTEKLGLPGLEFTPHGVLAYAIGYEVGWAKGREDARAGRLVLEAYGFGTITPGAPHFSAESLEKHHIEIEHIAGCVISAREAAHARGYNVAMIAEIKRRCGIAVVKEAEDEDARWLQSYDDGKLMGRADALSEIQAGHLALEVMDRTLGPSESREKMIRDRYQIVLRRVSAGNDPKMTNKAAGHVAGNNEVVEAEVTRRFGEGAVETMWRLLFETPLNPDRESVR